MVVGKLGREIIEEHVTVNMGSVGGDFGQPKNKGLVGSCVLCVVCCFVVQNLIIREPCAIGVLLFPLRL